MQENALFEWDNYYFGLTGKHSLVALGPGTPDWEMLSASVKPLLQQNKLIGAYWQIGEYLVLQEQCGRYRARYGVRMLQKLSRELTKEYGSGFSERNLLNMRKLYIFFQIPQTLLNNCLTWSHYVEIFKSRTGEEMYFYKEQAEKGKWSVRHLKQQMNARLYYTLEIYSSSIRHKVTI